MRVTTDRPLFRGRNRRVAGILMGWIVVLMLATIVVAWVR